MASSRRHGCDHGTTTTEYALALAAIALAVATVWAVGGPRLAATVERAWCRLTGCDAAAAAEAPVDPWDAPDPLTRATWGRAVILGDSFASGEGNGKYGSLGSAPSCHASASAHGRLLVGVLGMDRRASFAACTGARVGDLTARRDARPAQLDRLDGDTSLVTLSIGGNDLGWADALKNCAVRASACRSGTPLDQALTARIRAMGATLERTYTEVRRRAPHARILVTGYPRFFPTSPEADYTQAFGLITVFDPATQRWANRRLVEFNRTIRNAAKRAGVEYVEMTDAFAGHELTTEHPWYHGIEYQAGWPPIEPATMHPTARGQAAMAALVEAQVRRPIR